MIVLIAVFSRDSKHLLLKNVGGNVENFLPFHELFFGKNSWWLLTFPCSWIQLTCNTPEQANLIILPSLFVVVMERSIAKQPLFLCPKLFYTLNILGINAKLVLERICERLQRIDCYSVGLIIFFMIKCNIKQNFWKNLFKCWHQLII